MKKVYIAIDPIDAYMIMNILNNYGIQAVVQGENLYGLRGALPMTSDTSPSVWIIQDSDYEKAINILRGSLEEIEEKKDGDNWICHKCGEEVEGKLDKCWNCGKEKNPPC